MNLVQALQNSAYNFSLNGIADSHTEARILLQHVLNLSPAEIYAQPGLMLSQEEIKDLQHLFERRLTREPAAYIVNHKEFFGIDFYVDSRVLIPRPETELLVEAALKFAQDSVYHQPHRTPFLVADIGTGCGAIAISLALNLSQSRIYATDMSPAALQVAQWNCEKHNITEKIILLKGNLLEPIPEPIDLIVANLPYIKSSELASLSPETVNFEPRMALDGGWSGLEHIRQLIHQAKNKVRPQGCILLEIGKGQDKAVVSITKRYLSGASIELMRDLSGIKRAVKITC
jgi:release factor glutamine methyltransferase